MMNDPDPSVAIRPSIVTHPASSGRSSDTTTRPIATRSPCTHARSSLRPLLAVAIVHASLNASVSEPSTRRLVRARPAIQEPAIDPLHHRIVLRGAGPVLLTLDEPVLETIGEPSASV